MGDDQMVLCVHRCLHVVAHHGRSLGAVGGHGSCVRVRLGDLPIGHHLQLRLDDLKVLQALAHLLDLALQTLGLGLHLNWLGSICSLQGIKVALDTLLQLPFTSLNLAWREVALAVVDGLELAAVDGHNGVGKQLQFAAQDHEATTDVANAFAVVAAEVRNGLEVWGEAAGQPHQFHVAQAFALQPAGGLDAVEVTVQIELQQHNSTDG